MNRLIAVVATAVVVNGERTVIQPGQSLPELSDHDAEALKRSGAALDPDLDDEARKAVDDAALAAAASYQAERERVQAAAKSIATPPDQVDQVDQGQQTQQGQQVQSKPAAKTAKKS